MKIKLKIELADGKTVELSEDKARELYLKLNEYFGQKDYISWPYPIYPNIDPWWTRPVITNGDSTDWTPQIVKITC